MNQLDTIMEVATQRHQAGNLREAEGLYRQVLSQQPDHPDALHLLGVIAFQAGNIPASADLIGRAIELNPTAGEYYGNLGLVLARQRKIPEAVEMYRRALQLRPGNPEALFNLGNGLHDLGKMAEAVTALRQAIAARPNYAAAHVNLARVLRRMGEPKAAVIEYRKAEQLQPLGAELIFELANTLQQTGELDEAIATYHRAIALKPDYTEAYNNLGNALCGAGREAQAVWAYQKALELKPGAPQTLSNLGNAYCALCEFDQSVRILRQAVELAPDRPEIIAGLGNALRRRGDLDEAKTVLERSLAIRPDAQVWGNLADVFQKKSEYDQAISCCRKSLAMDNECVDALNTLGAAFAAQGNLEEGMANFQRALDLLPDLPSTLNNVGNALHARGEIERAVGYYRRAIEIAPDYALVHFNLGLMYLLWGNLELGWPEYEWRWHVRQFGPRSNFKRPWWNGNELHGQRILLHAEQGFGDVIQFIRYLPMVVERGGRIVLACHSELHRLLEGIGLKYGQWGSLIEDWVKPDGDFPEYDTHCPLMSLPHAFKTNLTNIPIQAPYVWAEDALARQWRKRMEAMSGRKIGIAWAGRAIHPNDKNRSFPISTFAPLAQISGARWFSLQTGEPSRQAAQAPFELTDWSGDLRDFADTAALVANLDLVISADTAVVHLAAAMGKPVWVLLPQVPDWRWMIGRTDSPWYPSMRLFRQETPGDWTMPISHILQAFKSQ